MPWPFNLFGYLKMYPMIPRHGDTVTFGDNMVTRTMTAPAACGMASIPRRRREAITFGDWAACIPRRPGAGVTFYRHGDHSHRFLFDDIDYSLVVRAWSFC